MTSNKTTPSGAATSERAKEQGADQPTSCGHFNTKSTRRQPVADILLHGADHATTAKDIASVLGWNTRTVTKEIQIERLCGIPIAANENGYFISESDSEMDEFLRVLESREREIRATRKAVAATRQQRMIFGGGEE